MLSFAGVGPLAGHWMASFVMKEGGFSRFEDFLAFRLRKDDFFRF
jgi:hypothetical protein